MQITSFEAVNERHAALVREAQTERLARSLRTGAGRGSRSGARLASRRTTDGEAADVRVRWGTPEDKGDISDLLDLNGVPRRLLREGFIVAEKGGRVLAAVQYRTGSKRLTLGLLVADPWVEERPLAEALHNGARELAREIGASKVR